MGMVIMTPQFLSLVELEGLCRKALVNLRSRHEFMLALKSLPEMLNDEVIEGMTLEPEMYEVEGTIHLYSE